MYMYHINPKYSDGQIVVNSVDKDQKPYFMWQNAVSDQGLHCLPFIWQMFRPINKHWNDLVEIDSSDKSLDYLTDNRSWPFKKDNKVIVKVFS